MSVFFIKIKQTIFWLQHLVLKEYYPSYNETMLKRFIWSKIVSGN